MAKKRVKLVDIAKELDVSVGLVSLVLSGKAKEHRISDSLSEKVLAKADEMGYRGNQLARGLRTGRSGIIGLIVADIANPYFGKLARHIENETGRFGYQIMIGSSDENAEKLEKIIGVFQSRQVDGMIIVPVAGSDQDIAKCRQSGLPVVLIDRYCRNMEEDFVCTDNADGARKLTQHLIDRGYRKIAAFVYNTSTSNNLDRINSYRELIAETGIQEEALVYEVGFSELESSLNARLRNALDKGCDAFFFANNSLGIKSLKIFGDLKMEVGKDIGFVSFDNPEVYHIVRPSITCYQQPIEQMSHLAVQHLLDKMEDTAYEQETRRLIKGELIIRNSC